MNGSIGRSAQGGYHAVLGAWVRIEVPDIWLDVAIYDAEDGSLVAETPSPVTISLADFDARCEGWATSRAYLGTGFGSAEDTALACAIDGRDVSVVVAVSELDDPDSPTEVTMDGQIDLDASFVPCDTR